MPFTRADAAAAGISRSMLRGSRFRRIFRDVYAHEQAQPNPFVRVQAALRIHPPDAVASHVSAARVYRLPVPGIPEEHITVRRPADRRKRPGLVNHVISEPVVNHKVYNRQGRLLYRFDLSYPKLMLLIEYDGKQHRENLEQWDHDIDRREWFDHNGWMLVPVVARGMYRRPDQTVEPVLEALKLRGCPNLTRRLSDAWRPYFPVRP